MVVMGKTFKIAVTSAEAGIGGRNSGEMGRVSLRQRYEFGLMGNLREPPALPVLLGLFDPLSA
jgi:hypothetical protein